VRILSSSGASSLGGTWPTSQTWSASIESRAGQSRRLSRQCREPPFGSAPEQLIGCWRALPTARTCASYGTSLCARTGSRRNTRTIFASARLIVTMPATCPARVAICCRPFGRSQHPSRLGTISSARAFPCCVAEPTQLQSAIPRGIGLTSHVATCEWVGAVVGHAVTSVRCISQSGQEALDPRPAPCHPNRVPRLQPTGAQAGANRIPIPGTPWPHDLTRPSGTREKQLLRDASC